ncbi:TM2 domain-containing protein [Sulfurirhabdus autotrophica]|uniref:Uncharacterized protein n=1 Tax=Sulfurirhabdus autotrophica TaxID=1706046 RepID=A0A4R3YE15_9PROT|nr:TM2 domain-containing protein [Sulfurirhabdus autotrophica]TCV90082.1 hypothetical protein EDC63_10147 [Sulfurirhabdus autotrophica]
MHEAWKNLDLEGQGLQSANLRLVQLMKKRKVANSWLLLFPSGMHRAYLNDARTAWIYRILTLTIVTLFIIGHKLPALVILAGQIGFALYDIRWIEDRIASLNKQIRMQVYLKQGSAAPKDFKGRYTDDGLDDYLKTKEQERGGHTPINLSEQATSPSRVPSFAQQEAMLKELAKAKNKKD